MFGFDAGISRSYSVKYAVNQKDMDTAAGPAACRFEALQNQSSDAWVSQ